LKIIIDDDDEGEDDDDDEADDADDVERTRTGPSAARSDLEHRVNHNSKISHFYSFSAHTKKAGQQARQDEVFGRNIGNCGLL
jgi:hypothetical protein